MLSRAKNVSGVHCVASAYANPANYFYKDVTVSFHRLPSDKQQLAYWQLRSEKFFTGGA